jgi:hypothetical protein
VLAQDERPTVAEPHDLRVDVDRVEVASHLDLPHPGQIADAPRAGERTRERRREARFEAVAAPGAVDAQKRELAQSGIS